MTPSPFLGELLGTFVLILLGNGVVANVCLKQTKGENAGWLVITAGWAFAVMIGIFVAQALGSPSAHLNPAITLAAAITSENFSQLLPFWAAQFLGAFLGATLVWLQYRPHFAVTEDTPTKLAVFATGPAIENAPANFASEIIGTAMLVFGANAIGASQSGTLTPYFVGVLVWSIGLSLGGPTGYGINPARDLAPRLAHFLLPIEGKGSSRWDYAWIPVAGPLLGAVIGGLLFCGIVGC